MLKIFRYVSPSHIVDFPCTVVWALFMDTHCTDTESVDLMTITIKEKKKKSVLTCKLSD